ncbi:MAG: 6-phosphofructokinase 1 [Motiliproteus sp.]|jgi:6-phosphofructokinase 1
MYHFPQLKSEKRLSRIAVLTSGGDAPGMNAAIRAVVRAGNSEGIEVFGIYRGFSGLVEADIWPLNSVAVANILHRGGTCLKSDRCPAFQQPSGRLQAAATLREMAIEALVVIGGDGSLTGAHLLHQETGFPVIGIPGTIDNDITGTEDSIGFDTAVNTALDAIDRIRDTASSHDRLFLVEVMGRSSGLIAAHAGIAGGAELILIPDSPIEFQTLCDSLIQSRLNGRMSSIIVIAEGEPGRTQRLASKLQVQGFEPRVCILGHTQRGGAPSGHDRVLASCLGAMAISHLQAGISDVMLAVQRNEITAVPLATILEPHQFEDQWVLELARKLHG